MSKASQEKVIKKNKPLQGWELAIAQANEKIKALERAISIFEDELRRGEPFPRDEATSKKAAA